MLSMKPAAEFAKARRRERRGQPRLKIRLTGRYLLRDGREAACVVVDLSATGLSLICFERGRVDDPVVIYLDAGIGMVRGVIVRVHPDGFAVKLVNAPSKGVANLARLVEQKAALHPSSPRSA
jgi:hypothetical protein